jgi:hypothetical protein
MEKILHYYFSLVVSFKKRDIFARCFLWRQNNSEVNHSTLPVSGEGGWSVSRGNVQQWTLQQEGLQTKEETTTQLQDWNMECKNLESRKQI